MNELKVNPRFEKFSPKKKPDEIEELKNSLKKKGYVGSPILTWHGFIVDGHNRYKVCQELGIEIDLEKNVEELELGDFAEEIDAMDWMLTHQLSSKNLSPGEKLAMMDEFKEEVRIENEKKRLSTLKQNQTTNRSLQLEASNENNRDRSLNTDRQTAQKAGVGVGTVARYNKVMNSNDEELKEKVKTGQVTVNKAYEEVRKRETRVCKTCGKEKKIIDFFGNDAICKECSRKESEKNINTLQMMTSKPTEENMKIYQEVTTARNAKDYINQDIELTWLSNICSDFISQVNDKFFNLLCVIEKMDQEHIKKANDIFEDFISDIFNIQEKIKTKKEI